VPLRFRARPPDGSGHSGGAVAARARQRVGPGGGGGGVPAGGGGVPAGGGGGGGGGVLTGLGAGVEVYAGAEPLATGIWLPLAYMHCM